MSTNPYINQRYRPEQNLYEELVIESIKFYGQDCYYIPRDLIRSDEILNEEYSRFSNSYVIETYILNTDGFEGEGNLLSKFGLEIRDQATFIIAKSRFSQLLNNSQNDITSPRPREGDLMYLPLSNSMFEIKFVEHEKPFYQLSNLTVYELQCELFEYSTEQFDTGIEKIDTFESKKSLDQLIIDIQMGTVAFRKKENVTQQISQDPDIFVTGQVVKYIEEQKSPFRSGKLYLSRTKSSDGEIRSFEVTNEEENISNLISVSNPSKNDWIITKVYNDIKDGDEYMPSDKFGKNSEFQIQGDEIIDFSERNPFGEPF